MQTHIVQPVRLSIEFVTRNRLQLILQVLFMRPILCASAILPPEPFDSRQTHLESLVLIISPPDILGQLLELLDLLLILPFEATSDLFHELVIVHIGPSVPDDLGLAGEEVEFEELEERGEGLYLRFLDCVTAGWINWTGWQVQRGRVGYISKLGLYMELECEALEGGDESGNQADHLLSEISRSSKDYLVKASTKDPRREKLYVQHQPLCSLTLMTNSMRISPASSTKVKREKQNRKRTDDETFLLDLPLSLGILLVIVCRHVAQILLVNRADVESSVWVVGRKGKRPRCERSRLRLRLR